MTVSDPVEAVVAYLEERDFIRWPEPLMIRGVKFSFDAVLHGPEGFSDLVLVCDTLEHDRDEDIVRKVLGLARALDMARKTNPITTVIVGRRPELSLIAQLTNVSRVLALGALDAAVDVTAHLDNWLAVLTPLQIAAPTESVADPMTELREAAFGLRSDLLALLDAAVDGEKSVRLKVNALIEKDLVPFLEENE